MTPHSSFCVCNRCLINRMPGGLDHRANPLTRPNTPRHHKSMPPASPPVAAPDDLQRIEAKLDHLITVVETRKALVEGLDDRIAVVQSVERGLATTSLKIAAARALSSGIGGAVAGAVAGGFVAYFLIHAGLQPVALVFAALASPR